MTRLVWIAALILGAVSNVAGGLDGPSDCGAPPRRNS